VPALILVLCAAPALAGFFSYLPAAKRLPAAFPAPVVGAAAAVLAAAGLGIARMSGAEATLGIGPEVVLAADGLAVIVALVVGTVGLTVMSYASTNLQGDQVSSRFFAAGGVVLSATQVMALGARPSVLVAGWVITSIAVVFLVGFRRDAGGVRAARRTGSALLVGDVALLGALGAVLVGIGYPAFADLAGASADLRASSIALPFGAELGVAALVGGLLVVAAAVRAGQQLAPAWLPLTVEAPTPVSALLHAGVVNAGAVLLIRFSPVFADEAVVAWLLVAVTTVTIVAVTAAVRSRPDVKGALALSTSAQMGFMLLAIGVGAPAAALAHLAGHAFYKSERFLSAGGAVVAARTARLHRPTGPAPLHAAAGWALAGSGALLVLAIALLLDPAAMHGAGGWLLGVTGTAAIAVGLASWLARSPYSLVVSSAIGLTVGGAGFVALVAGASIAEAGLGPVEGGGWASAPLSLALLALALVASAALRGNARTSPPLTAALGRTAHPGRPQAPARDGAPSLVRSAW